MKMLGSELKSRETVAEEMIRPERLEQVFTPPPYATHLPTAGTEDFGERIDYGLPAPAQIPPKVSSVATPLYYKMNSKPLGKFVIISNSNFELARSYGGKLRDRPGSEKDVTQLKKTFGADKLFDVCPFENLKAKEMETCLASFGDEDFTDYDCFVCCIMTHGNRSSLYGTDGETLDIQHALSLFKLSPTLKGKPKIFFFQACRGLEKEHSTDSGGNLPHYSMPSSADFFLGYATPPGRYSIESANNLNDMHGIMLF